MDTLETSTERALAERRARAGRRPAGGRRRRAGARLHDARGARRHPGREVRGRRDRAVAGRLDARRHDPARPALLADERVNVVVADIAAALAEAADASYDLVLLDVDNGPGYLVHDANAALYEPPFLRGRSGCCARRARWSSGPADAAPELEAALREVFGNVEARAARRAAAGARRALLALRRAGTVHSMSDEAIRTEHDSMGEVRVPADALWRAQTQRAVENFPISGTPLEPAPHPRAGAGQGRGRRRQRRARRPRPASRPTAIAAAAARGRRRRARRRSSRSTSSRPARAPAPT